MATEHATTQAVQITSGLILAGGRSRRFGRNKLAEQVDGRSLLAHVVARLRPLCSELILLTAADAFLPQDVALGDGIRLVSDRQPGEGPLPALVNALAQAEGEVSLLVGGDMPYLAAEILLRLTTEVRVGGEIAVLMRDGEPEPLPIALRTGPARTTAQRLAAQGERSLRGLLRAADLREIDEEDWRLIDPSAASLRDIDTPDDLAPARPSAQFSARTLAQAGLQPAPGWLAEAQSPNELANDSQDQYADREGD